MSETNVAMSSSASAVNAVTYIISSKTNISLGFITTIGFYPGIIIKCGKKKLMLQAVEWYAFLKYKEDIINYFKKRRINVVNHVRITKKCKYCNCIESKEIINGNDKTEKEVKVPENHIIEVGMDFKIIFTKQLSPSTTIKMIILEKDGIRMQFDKHDILTLLNLNPLISYRLERLTQLKFYQFYNSCIEFIKEQLIHRPTEDPIKDILLPALEPEQINITDETTKELSTINYYYETTEIMHEISIFKSDLLLEHIKT